MPAATIAAVRDGFATPPEAPVVLSTRSFSQPYYNIPLFVDAIPALLARRPDAVFWIAGYEGDDSGVRAQAERLGVAHAVRFLGRVPHETLQDVVAAADVYITIPSLDATAVSLLEAMAAGKAIVASALPVGGGVDRRRRDRPRRPAGRTRAARGGDRRPDRRSRAARPPRRGRAPRRRARAPTGTVT